MANGEEDLHEKNRYRQKPLKDSRYIHWNSRLGEEDAQMLAEKSLGWKSYRQNRGDYDDD